MEVPRRLKPGELGQIQRWARQAGMDRQESQTNFCSCGAMKKIGQGGKFCPRGCRAEYLSEHVIALNEVSR